MLWKSLREAPIRSQPAPSKDPSRLKISGLGAPRLRSMYQPFETTLSGKTREMDQPSISAPTVVVLFWLDTGHPSSKSPNLTECILPPIPESEIFIRKNLYLDMPSSDRSKTYLTDRTKLATAKTKTTHENLRVLSNACRGRMVYNTLFFEFVIATILFELCVSQPPLCRTRCT